MELFERAHVRKVTKEKKSEKESIKKQFKQMLYGYKNSNNKIIKDSLNLNTELDDSSSVSGFSDLNLTNSSIEDLDQSISVQSNHNTIENDEKGSIISNTNDEDDENSKSTDSITAEFINNTDPISEEIDSEMNSYSDTDISLASGTSGRRCDNSQSFDPDGELASKIISKLNKKEHERELERYRLCGKEPFYSKFIKTESIVSDGGFSHSTKKSLNVKQKNINPSFLLQKIAEDDEENCLADSDVSNSFDSECRSPPFISITAMDMPSQSFEDLLGDYKHPTNRNLPSEHNNNFTSASTELFTEQTMNVDVHMEEDVSSLVPELDEEPVVDDIVDLDSTELCDDSTNICDSTMEFKRSVIEPTMEQLHNIISHLKIFYCTNTCIIVIKHPTEIYIQGKVKIQALGGKVEVFGYTLKDSVYNLYAPYYSCAQCIKTVANDNCYYGLFGKLTKAGLTVAEAENIVTTLGTNDSIICFKKFQSKTTDFVETNFTLSNLFVKPFKHNNEHLLEASDTLGCSLYLTKPWKYFIENPIWSQTHQFASKDYSRGIICGGKGVGKSTFLRYQANKLLEKGPVLVLDLDPGQCEFTVAGNLSATVVTEPLLGPNFTHLRKPEIMLNIGIINTMDNIKCYINAIQRLMSYCNSREDLKNMPWIVNTMGMTNALGMKLMVIIIMLTKPTYLMQYNAKSAKKCFDLYLNMEGVRYFYNDNKIDYLFKQITFPEDLDYAFILVEETDRPGKSSYSLTPKDERFLNYLAYFSEMVDIYRTDNLLAVVPYEISLQNISVYSNIKINKDCILKVLNGKAVALCAHTSQCHISGVFTLFDKPLVCHGNGLIRGVDWIREVLYIITPVPQDILRLVNCLVYADWSPDMGNFNTYLPHGTAVPYCTRAYEQHRHLMTSPRRRFNPLQLLNMTRSS